MILIIIVGWPELAASNGNERRVIVNNIYIIIVIFVVAFSKEGGVELYCGESYLADRHL